MVEHSSKVAVYLPALDAGGAEMAMLRIATGIAERGFAVDLVLARRTGGLLERVPDSIRVVDLAAGPPAAVTKVWALARYLRRERPAALISALDVINTATLGRRLAGVPTRVVLSVQTNLSQQFSDKPAGGAYRLRRGLVRALYPRTDVLVAASQGVADDVTRIVGSGVGTITVIPNPVVTPGLAERARAHVEHPFFADGQPPVVIGVGRLVRQKDFATLVEAFATVRAQRDARLMILGGGDPREPETERDLRALISARGLDEDVALPGWVDEPEAYVARARVFALSSIYEGFGNVVAEALAVGTTVVSTDCESGPSEILGGGAYGRLVPVSDHSALAQGILDALEAPTAAAELLARADHYRTERIAGEYLKLAVLETTL